MHHMYAVAVTDTAVHEHLPHIELHSSSQVRLCVYESTDFFCACKKDLYY